MGWVWLGLFALSTGFLLWLEQRQLRRSRKPPAWAPSPTGLPLAAAGSAYLLLSFGV